MCFRYSRHLLRLHDAAALSYIDLDYLRRLLLQHIRKLILRDQPFPRRDRDASVRGDACHLVHVLGRHRLLEPERVILLEHVRRPYRRVGRELPMCANAHFHRIADRIPD